MTKKMTTHGIETRIANLSAQVEYYDRILEEGTANAPIVRSVRDEMLAQIARLRAQRILSTDFLLAKLIERANGGR